MAAPKYPKKSARAADGTKKKASLKKMPKPVPEKGEPESAGTEEILPKETPASGKEARPKKKKKFEVSYALAFPLLGLLGGIGIYVLDSSRLFYSCLFFLSGLFLGLASSFYEGEKKEGLSEISAVYSSMVPPLLAEKSVKESLKESLSGSNSSRLKDFLSDVLTKKESGEKADYSYLSSLEGENRKAVLTLVEVLNGEEGEEGREELLRTAASLRKKDGTKEETFLNAAVCACDLFLLLLFFLETGGFSL